MRAQQVTVITDILRNQDCVDPLPLLFVLLFVLEDAVGSVSNVCVRVQAVLAGLKAAQEREAEALLTLPPPPPPCESRQGLGGLGARA